jgi:hypothetical protein
MVIVFFVQGLCHCASAPTESLIPTATTGSGSDSDALPVAGRRVRWKFVERPKEPLDADAQAEAQADGGESTVATMRPPRTWRATMVASLALPPEGPLPTPLRPARPPAWESQGPWEP